MRRTDREICEFSQKLDIIEKGEICHLAFKGDKYPYLIALNYGYEVNGKHLVLYFHGAMEGYKYVLMAKDSHVAFMIDVHKPYEKNSLTTRYESVAGTGKIRVINDEEEKLKAMKLFLKHYNETKIMVTPEFIKHTKICCLEVMSITGKHNL